MEGKSPSTWGIFYCFPRRTNRELDQKCSRWNWSQYSHRTLAVQPTTMPPPMKCYCPITLIIFKFLQVKFGLVDALCEDLQFFCLVSNGCDISHTGT